MIGSTFSYRAANRDGGIVTGSVACSDETALAEMLARRGLFLVAATGSKESRRRRAPLAARDLAVGLRMLGDLLEAGLPISRVLASFGDVAPTPWRRSIPGLQQSIREGRSLAFALEEAALDVPPLVIGLIQAGEAGGGVGAAVRHAADLAEESATMRAAVRSALAYPTILAIAGSGAIGVLVVYVLPRFATILGDLGQSLPAGARFVLGAATLARAAIAPAIMGSILAGAAMAIWTSTTAGRRRWHRTLLAVPLVGDVRFASATARVTATLATLIRSGVPIRQSLRYAARAAGDAEVEARVLRAREMIAAGQRLSTALAAQAAITPLAARLAGAGEDSGRLVDMLRHAGRLEQDRADRLTRTAVRILEPVLVLVFAVVIAGVSAALLQAIYSVRPA